MSDIIRVRCGGCDVKIKAPLKYQGRQVKCPQCGADVTIPLAESARPAIFDSPDTVTPSAAMAPVLMSEESNSRPRQGVVSQRPASKETVTVLGDDAFEEPRRPAKKKSADDDFANVDFADYEDYGPIEDYGAPPKQRSSSRSSATASPRRKKVSKPAKSSGDSTIDPSIVGGIVMMVGAVIWFVVGLKFGVIFFYPPILFVVGIVAFVKGLID